MKVYKIEKSQYPVDDKKYIVVMYSETQNGYNCGRVYKGTYRECHDYKKRLENEYR